MIKVIEMKKEDARPCIIKYPRDTMGNGEWKKAFFHMWIRAKDICGKKTLYAVVEVENGSVMDIEARYIRFTDRDKSEFEMQKA